VIKHGGNTAKVREIIIYETSSTALDFFNLVLLILQVWRPHVWQYESVTFS